MIIMQFRHKVISGTNNARRGEERTLKVSANWIVFGFGKVVFRFIKAASKKLIARQRRRPQSHQVG